MSRSGNPYDNAAMESFNATYKRECVGLAQKKGGYATREQAQAELFEYIELYYNRVRLHSALGYKGCDLEQWAKENDKWDKMTLVLFGTVYIVSSS